MKYYVRVWVAINLLQNRVRRRAVKNNRIHFWIPQKAGVFIST
jgi:hypothetical protein